MCDTTETASIIKNSLNNQGNLSTKTNYYEAFSMYFPINKAKWRKRIRHSILITIIFLTKEKAYKAYILVT